jgi:bile acid:Na+ symporter, BASS family
MILLRILETCVPAVAFLLMLAVGLDITRDGLRDVAGRWGFVIGATVAQATILPAAALMLLRIAGPEPRIAEYLLLVAACPGGGMSNVYVYLARANTALSVALTAFSSLLAIATIPLITEAYALILGRAPGFALPIPTLLVQLLVMAVIPVVIGAWVRDRWPEAERRHGRQLRVLSAVGVAVIVAIGLAQSATTLDAGLLTGGLLSVPFLLAGMASGWVLGLVCRVPSRDRFTLLVEFSVRSLAIAMVIEVTLLHHPDFVAFASVALLGQASLLMMAVRWYLRSTARE